ncbi:unnamed protein product [Caenorhabditis brenneri]
MDQKPPKPSKRLDLQGIRALAIIVVLGFHFFPEYCPNGYLGVDQFFVLSGFLMCMLLKRAENQSPCSLLSLAVDIFTHTWSLSVEIQFYFLAPFIFMVGSMLPKFQYFYYLLIGIFSFTFFYISPATEAFNSVFARIWQFLIGMVVYLLSNSKLSEIKYQSLNNEEEGGECEQKLLGDEESQETFECCPNEKLLKLSRIGRSFSYILLMMLVTVTGFPMVLKPEVVR